ncbi:hypothetical protein PENTCL1PPCAC_19526, partial [Pristionchus entomophagus]
MGAGLRTITGREGFVTEGPEPETGPEPEPGTGNRRLVEVLSQPADALAVALSAQHLAHVHLQRTRREVGARNLAFAGAHVLHAEVPLELVLAHRARLVDLVAEYDDGSGGHHLIPEQTLQLGLRLHQSLVVGGVDQEDDAVHGREVVLPHATRLSVASEVEGGEAHAAQRELLRRGMERGHVLRHAVVLKHVQQRRLAGVVQSEEDELARLLRQTEEVKHVREPAPQPRHLKL